MTKWTTADIPDQTGRTGRHHRRQHRASATRPPPRSPRKGAHVVLAVRNIEKGKKRRAASNRPQPGAQRRSYKSSTSTLTGVRSAAPPTQLALQSRHPSTC